MQACRLVDRLDIMAEHYTTETIVSALHETNGMVYLAARRLGCKAQTIYNRAKSTKVIQEAIDNSRGEMLDISEQKLRQAIMNGEAWAITFHLKTIGKSRGYVERQEVTGADGGALIVKFVDTSND